MQMGEHLGTGRLAALLAAAVLIAGCVEGTGADGDTDVDSDTDSDSDSDADVCVYHSDCVGQMCVHEGCDHERQLCGEGRCVDSPSCSSSKPCDHWKFCSSWPSDKVADRRCLWACLTDLDCPADGQCYYGLCEPYPVDWSETTPLSGRSAEDRGPLMAGVAEAIDDVPLGISMAGYGARPGEQTPFNAALGGTKGWLDYPLVQALALDDGYETVILMQVPMGWSSDMMRTMLALELQERRGVNYIDHIITMSNHSHSWPGRFWNVVPEAGLGAFGHGDYEGVISERRVKRWADVVEEALDSMVPARFGYAVDDQFDGQDKVHHRRRGQYTRLPDGRAATVDNHLLMLRVDHDQGEHAGKPMAVVVGFSSHGTFLYGEYISGDSPHGVVKETRRALEEEHGVPVVVFHDNTCGGDTSPAGGMHDATEDYGGVADYAGLNSLEWTLPLFHSLDGQTSAETEIRLGWKRVPISYFDLGYKYDYETDVGDYNDEFSLLSGGYLVYRLGAFQCTMNAPDDQDPETCCEDGDLGCLLSVEILNDFRSIPQFSKSTLDVLRIGPGDPSQDLFLSTIPGEPMTPMMWLYSEAAEAETQGVVPAENVFFIGFSQDHHFYILLADDWVQGGYEATMDIWGWAEGQYLFDRSLEVLKAVAAGEDAHQRPVAGEPWIKPIMAPERFAKHEPVPPATTPAADAGKILQQPPPAVERLDLIEIEWFGGFPNADWPLVSLEREVGGQFEPIVNAAGSRYNHFGDRMPVEYGWEEWLAFEWDEWKAGNISQGGRQNTWSARFEELMDFPEGRYRFRIQGSYCAPGAACDAWGNGLATYDVYSEPFEIVPCSTLWIWDIEYAGGEIRGRVAYPPGHITTDNGAIHKGKLGGASARSYRFRGMEIHPFYPGPLSTEADAAAVEVTITGEPTPLQSSQLVAREDFAYEYVEWRRDDFSERACGDKDGVWIPETELCESRQTRAARSVGFAVPYAAASGASFDVTVTVTDRWGNHGSGTATLAAP